MVVTSLMRGTLAVVRRAPTSLSTQCSASTSSAPIRALHSRAPPDPRALRQILLFKHKRHPPQPIEKPQDFVSAISKSRRGDMSGIITALGGEEKASVAKLKKLRGYQLKTAGVAVKDRKYVLWCVDRFKKGQHPAMIAYDAKPPKKIRGWGPRVQNGVRVRGVARPGDLRAAKK